MVLNHPHIIKECNCGKRMRKKAKEIHDAIVELSKELKWNETAPAVVASSEKLHTYALLKGLITKEERNLLRVYFEN